MCFFRRQPRRGQSERLTANGVMCRDPGAAPNFAAIQKMLDIYTEAGMLPKMDVAQFKHPTIVAPLQ